MWRSSTYFPQCHCRPLFLSQAIMNEWVIRKTKHETKRIHIKIHN